MFGRVLRKLGGVGNNGRLGSSKIRFFISATWSSHENSLCWDSFGQWSRSCDIVILLSYIFPNFVLLLIGFRPMLFIRFS